MVKKKIVRKVDEMTLIKSIFPQKNERLVIRKTNKFDNMSQDDIKEFNDITKKTRGLSRITYKDIFGGSAN